MFLEIWVRRGPHLGSPQAAVFVDLSTRSLARLPRRFAHPQQMLRSFDPGHPRQMLRFVDPGHPQQMLRSVDP